MANVILNGVTKFYSEAAGVVDLSIEIQHGEFLVLFGPHASGKTTVLRLLAGLEPVTDGEIYIDDRLVNGLPFKDRGVGLVGVQSDTLPPHKHIRRTVYDYIALDLKRQGLPRDEIESRVREIARRMALEVLLPRSLKQLSGDRPFHAEMARALVTQPGVVLMDEPLRFVEGHEVSIRADINDMHRRLDKTFVYATRDWVDALTLGDRIAVILDGHLQQVGSRWALYDTPATVYVASSIGDPCMNLLSARLLERHDGMAVDCGDFVLEVPEDKANAYRPYRGKDVILGIRPEDIHLPGYAPEAIKGVVVDAKVCHSIEFRGVEVVVPLKTSGHAFIGRFNSRAALIVGKEMSVVFDLDRIHLFDAETEMAIR